MEVAWVFPQCKIDTKPVVVLWPRPAAQRGDAGILSSCTILQRFVHWSTFLNMQWCCSTCCVLSPQGGFTHTGYWQASLSDHYKSDNKTQFRKTTTAKFCVPISCLSRGADVPGRFFCLDSGCVHLRFSSLHLKEVVLTDRPLRQSSSMKGMNEQSDVSVLTLGLKD